MKRLIVTLLVLAVMPFALSAQTETTISRNAEKIARALYYIETRYVDTVDLDKAVDEVLNGLMERLDPHSIYIPQSQAESVNEPLDGSFEGIGIEFSIIADTLTVQSVFPGGPSEAVGLRAGDKIVAVDGENIAGVGLSNDGVRSRLRGPKGTRVTLSVLRSETPLEFVIRRERIPIESVEAAYEPEKGVVYIKISRFAQNTGEEFIDALLKNAKTRPRGIIIDLRGNGGGFMHVADMLADMFLEEGQVIVRTEGNGIEQEDCATGRGFYKEGPLVVLVDENSASASEILAGALQDWDRAVIVGRRTFGKGLVQQQYAFSDGSEIRLTVARYHTPSGRVVQSPYRMGERDAYFRQARERYAHGEAFSRDSIHLPDSLQFKTLKLGRTVYGGGGIMPDVFVPYDTTGINVYLTRAIGSGAVQEFAYDYLDKHRSGLTADDIKAFEKQYVRFEAEVWDGLIAYCAGKGIKPASDEELAACAPILRTRLKALLARGVLGSTGYWQVINREEDPEFQRALEIINTWKGVFPTSL